MNRKTVYIVIPIYNNAIYLKKCLESVFNQTYKNIYVICINDGSTDYSLDILETYASLPNMKLINQGKNMGVSVARNTGLSFIIDKKDGSYVAFIDADDWIDNNYIETLVNIMELHSVDVVCGASFYADRDVYKPIKNIENDCVFSSLEATRLLIRDETIQSFPHSKLFKLELWNNIRFDPNLFYMEDQDVIYKVFYSSKKVFVSNYSGYYYRQDNPESTTKKMIDTNKVISGLKAYYNICHYHFLHDDRDYLLPSIHNALANAYLSLIPYYKKREASPSDKNFIKQLKAYLKTNKVIKYYEPRDRNCRIKKILYLCSPGLYPFVFRLIKKI